MTHAIHDFAGKLRQPGVLPTLEAYVAWRVAVREAREAGTEEPPPPAIAPVSINLDLTVACNYRCTHCIDWDVLNTGHRLAEDDLRASIERMAERGLRSVILIGGGEPTLYPGFVGFVAFLKEQGLDVAIVSNGSRCDRLLEAVPHLGRRDWIRLSLDSGSNELFRAMHRPNGSVTLESICAAVPGIKQANPLPRIGFSFIIVWDGAVRDDEELLENVHEIELAAGLAKEYRFDYISLKPVLERQADGAEVMNPARAAQRRATLERIRAEVERAKELADERFDVYESINLRVLEEGTWRDFTRQPRTCHMQALRQVVSPLGLYNCPAHRGVERARLGAGDAWTDPEGAGAALAGILDRFDAEAECREVTCLYNEVNWWIEARIADGAPITAGPERGDTFL